MEQPLAVILQTVLLDIPKQATVLPIHGSILTSNRDICRLACCCMNKQHNGLSEKICTRECLSRGLSRGLSEVNIENLDNFKNLGQTQSTRLIYKTLETHKCQQPQPSRLPRKPEDIFVNVRKSL